MSHGRGNRRLTDVDRRSHVLDLTIFVLRRGFQDGEDSLNEIDTLGNYGALQEIQVFTVGDPTNPLPADMIFTTAEFRSQLVGVVVCDIQAHLRHWF